MGEAGELAKVIEHESIIWTTAEDIAAERREVRRLRAEENRKWAILRRYVANVRRWESRVRRLEAELSTLGRKGWVYLTGAERERYRALRDRLLPMASVRLLHWSDQREAIIRELVLERETRFAEEDRLARKRIRPPPPPPPRLYRIKIRLYNFERKPTPTGSFQTFWEIDALIDPETGLVDWDWWLTQEEVQICRYHMVGFFKGFAKWRSPEQVGLAYFDEPTGVPYEEETVKYRRTKQGVPYAKNISEDFIAKAEALTVGELIVGISSIEPRPVDTPEGVYFEEAMIIDADGLIKWHERRERFVWRPTEAQIEKVKKELKIE